MPALQVVDGMLATLGPKHKTVANQVISPPLVNGVNLISVQALKFLLSHRDTIVILLKNEADQVPLAIVEEMHLIVSLCASVLPLVPKSELVRIRVFLLLKTEFWLQSSSNSGFGGIHVAVLSLATRTLNVHHWTRRMEPQTDAEMLEASAYTSGT